VVLSTSSGAQREEVEEVEEVDDERDRAGGRVGGSGACLFEKASFDVRGNGFERVAERFSSLDMSCRCQKKCVCVCCMLCIWPGSG
jgi:hypothetical protein